MIDFRAVSFPVACNKRKMVSLSTAWEGSGSEIPCRPPGDSCRGGCADETNKSISSMLAP